MTESLAAVLAAAICLPHLLQLNAVAPATGMTIWLAALALRALGVLFGALSLILLVPRTDAFHLVAQWCWHAVIPFVAAHLGLDGHRLGHAASLAPSLVLSASLASASFGLVHAARSVRRLLRRHALGEGPLDSVIVAGPDLLVAAAGVARPRVLVSAGVLTEFDDAELAASVAHERGHIERRHRYVLLAAELCRSLACFLPGTGTAIQGLRFHVERDADAWALRRRHDPLALASAICKAATVPRTQPTFLSLGGGPGTADRVRQLTTEDTSTPGGARHRLAAVTAVAMVSLTLALGALVPAATAEGLRALDTPVSQSCSH